MDPDIVALKVDIMLADIGDRFRAERQALNLTMPVFAKRAGTTLQTIKNLENGQVRNLLVLIKASQACNKSFLYMMSSDWRMPKKPPTLAPYQVRALEAIAQGGSLAEAGARIGITREAMASVLSRIYERFEVRYKYGIDRRTEVLRIAREHNLIKEVPDGQTNG